MKMEGSKYIHGRSLRVLLLLGLIMAVAANTAGNS
jgi:hypothetical protein